MTDPIPKHQGQPDWQALPTVPGHRRRSRWRQARRHQDSDGPPAAHSPTQHPKHPFTIQSETPAQTLDQALAEMEAPPPPSNKCPASHQPLELPLRCAPRRERTPDRTAGIAWLPAMRLRSQRSPHHHALPTRPLPTRHSHFTLHTSRFSLLTSSSSSPPARPAASQDSPSGSSPAAPPPSRLPPDAPPPRRDSPPDHSPDHTARSPASVHS